MIDFSYIILLVITIILTYIINQHDHFDDKDTIVRIESLLVLFWRVLAILLVFNAFISALSFAQLSKIQLLYGCAIMFLSAWVLWTSRDVLSQNTNSQKS